MEMRDMLKCMRNIKSGDTFIKESTQKNTTDMRSLIKKTRQYLQESDNQVMELDQDREENKMRNFFKDLDVVIDYIELEVYDEGIFWGGTIDGVIQFVFKVTPNERDSEYQIYYLDDFDKDNPDNEEISKRIELYYDEFFKFWRDNKLNK